MTVHFPELSRPDLGTTTKRSKFYSQYTKRLLDLTLVLLSLPAVLPVVLLLAFAVFLQDGGKPFYRQRRVGRGGRIFTMWKLRSMVRDAEARLQAHLTENQASREEWNSKQKLSNDPRITPIGRVLRSSSLDELPQLLNVLTGDMSLVGPRPMLPEQKTLYSGEAYYTLRPGITGSWQISERNASSFSSRAVFDNDYAARLSLTTDIAILGATCSVVLKRTGC
ncbi:sugar transferase [Limimaricola litoreus]|uniref:Sugar transferase n=1 Tax=Limimaricola litoreus TaxID=2955316 RepID=A0A9X2FR14_9RHOB|nr:sugar transferase [Limimaricola litoreus]MCP1168384.1 sugar transferase [Limimaricola litoreus]